MGTSKPVTDDQLREVLLAVEANGKMAAARELGLTLNTIRYRYEIALARGMSVPPGHDEFEMEDLPDEVAPVEEIIERRFREFDRYHTAREARRLIDVKVKMDGPVGIVHMGDPHVDDKGCDLKTLLHHCDLIRNTEGLMGANLGDSSNNWVGRLQALFGEQETTKAEAWKLTEYFIQQVDWLYIIAGNHDLWSGAGDPLQWITRRSPGAYEAHGARLNLCFPNGKKVRVNARHDWKGHSQYNPVHGAAKAAMLGWRDHILTCGHKHVSGYNILKCPASGLISHAIRVAGYKRHDAYALELGLPDQNVSPAAVTVIRPDREDHDPGLVTVFHDVETAADFLTYLRRRK